MWSLQPVSPVSLGLARNFALRSDTIRNACNPSEVVAIAFSNTLQHGTSDRAARRTRAKIEADLAISSCTCVQRVCNAQCSETPGEQWYLYA